MKSIIILLALVAFCQAAPLDVKESTPEASTLGVGPISPDVISEPKPTEGKVVLLRDDVLHRQKRDEHKKPDSVKAHEQLQHDPHRPLTSPPRPLTSPTKPDSVGAHHEGLQHHAHKREAHHEPGHQEDAPKQVPHDAPEAELPKKEKRETHEKPDSVDSKESHAHHDHALTLQGDTLKTLTEALSAPEKKEKREAHHEEGHKEQPHSEDLAPHALPSAAPAVDLAKKEKRETQEKPDHVKTKELLEHHEHGATEHAATLPAHTEAHPAEKRAKRETHHEDGHHEHPQTEDLALPHTLPSAAPAVLLAKKEKRETPEKPDSDKAKASHDHHEHAATLLAHTEAHPAEKRAKRETHHEEEHHEHPQTEDLALPHTLPSAAPAVLLAKKEKRETQEKPDSDKSKESHDHHELGAADPTDIVKTLIGVHPASELTKKHEKRDIPVPTETKATADPAAIHKSEGGSTTPFTPHFKRPVPVDVLLHQKHDEKSTSSSEESKESKEKVKA